MLRQPICVFMGHVDHGKTSLQDFIRCTAVAKCEAGAITQIISSSTITTETLKKVCGNLLSNIKLTIPGILFIDTPGHAAFTNLRRRGGNLADIAVLVIDINEGLKPQTKESIEILKKYKTPFVIAFNKIDLIYGWKKKDNVLLKNLELQPESVKKNFDVKFYDILGKLYELGFECDRFDRVGDFTKKIAIVPVSAETGEGIPEILMVLSGLAQKYLEQNLDVDMESPGCATVLEVIEQKSLGLTVDAILYEGKIEKGDTIVIGGLNEPVVTKIRGLFELTKGRSKPLDKAHASSGIKIYAPDIKDVISGMPLKVAKEDIEKVKEEVQKEVEEVTLDTDDEGVVIKADSLGSLEALIGLLKDYGINIKKASVGPITKKDIADASSSINVLHRIILGFNIANVKNNEVKVISHDVIYKIVEDYQNWVEEETKKMEAEELKNITKPAKIQIIKGCIFRQSNPCVVGVQILSGTLKNDVDLIKANNNNAGHIKSMQMDKKNVSEVLKGKEVAISLPGITGGRQINEGDILYTDVPEKDFKRLKQLKKYLSIEEKDLLKEFAEIKRKENQLWGV